jgi:hypothetical protein
VKKRLDSTAERRRRKAFFDALDAAYDELRRDPNAARDFDAEMAAWHVTLVDGLFWDDPPPSKV